MSDINATITQPVIQITFPASGTGPAGPPGPSGGSVITWTAGENMSTGRVVVIDNGEAFYFQPTDATHHGRAYGITTTSATAGNDVDVQICGEVIDAAFTFSPDLPVWVDVDGEIVDTQPATTLIQKAGVTTTAQKILIDFSISIKKS